MDMAKRRSIWLIHNDASGSNDRDTLARINRDCDACGLAIAYRTSFPTERLPNPAMLDAAGVDLVAVFAGDGTINAAIDALAGWSGAVLVLPGGTMNLLYHRLFGELEMDAVLRAVADGEVLRRRPGIIASPLGQAYAGLLAGPGTSWNDVREALRDHNIFEMAAESRAAIAETLSGEPVCCREPRLGRESGYPLLLLEPHDDGIDILAYHAETALEYLDQTLALVRRDFREGPHDHLGKEQRLVLSGIAHARFGVLLDGEPAHAAEATEFVLAASEVDLLATRSDD